MLPHPAAPNAADVAQFCTNNSAAGVICNKPVDLKQHHCNGCRNGGSVDRKHAALARCLDARASHEIHPLLSVDTCARSCIDDCGYGFRISVHDAIDLLSHWGWTLVHLLRWTEITRRHPSIQFLQCVHVGACLSNTWPQNFWNPVFPSLSRNLLLSNSCRVREAMSERVFSTLMTSTPALYQHCCACCFVLMTRWTPPLFRCAAHDRNYLCHRFLSVLPIETFL